MAFNIELNRICDEDETFAYYIYEFSLPCELFKTERGKLRRKLKSVQGKIRIHMISGDVEVISFAEGDNGMYAQRAALALIKHWRQGDFPSKTCWAS